MASYERTRRNLNFQRRSQVYAYAAYALGLMNKKINPAQGYYSAKNLPIPQRNFRQFRNIIKEWNRNIISRDNTRAQFAAYKARLDSNARLYRNAGKSVRYSPNKKGYTWNHPGMAAHLERKLAEVRRPRTIALKYGKTWMEKSGVTKRRENSAKAANLDKNEARRKTAQANYNQILSNNKTHTGMNKVRHYTKLWLNKNLPVSATYKNAALIVHPNKGNRTHANNQAKRTALFKFLTSLK